MGWLIGKLTGVAGPYIVGALGGFILLLLATIGALKWQVAGLETDVAEARQATAECRQRKAKVAANRDELRGDLARLSGEVDRLAEQKAAIEDRNRARVAELRAESEARLRAIATAPAPDVPAEAANGWVFDRLREY